ncbi:hypothetical protein COS54_03310 [Candidatus Shapirobacteria bacterium CG03_land_8_20_14_0_80_39_12]|uniref:Sortase n=1 Tax=Candidatus Shapirobacteria bacterium CG03_land_8_20_14_0_80_39_12 TaxID=1974879 RepID=A0A2M7BAZ8_9BACT|nr:MAG: hypothetical protein COS54_03310 [Candidatus Shapirobacteria bacterium CG03_land_8_20_14_0_80_39_12]
MIPYRYVKRPPLVYQTRKINFNPKLVAGLLFLAGIFFFINAAYPIVSYQILIAPRFATSFASPTSEGAIAQSFGAVQEGLLPLLAENPQTTEVLGAEIDLADYTKASNWFPGEKVTFAQKENENLSYFFSIPKLGIENAKVLVGMEDLKKSLIQYPGTVPPGRYGNTVIFGHSVLPQFFNPKNYLTIFSTLPTLKIGDSILVEYNGIEYKYLVEQMIEVVPDDISILAQRYDDSYLTLITCVPPGTFLRRLIVRARLSKI